MLENIDSHSENRMQIIHVTKASFYWISIDSVANDTWNITSNIIVEQFPLTNLWFQLFWRKIPWLYLDLRLLMLFEDC